MRRPTVIGAAALVALILPASAQADYKQCRPVIDILGGTRYAGTDLYRISAQDVSCRTARRVALRGTYRGVKSVPNAKGLVVVNYRLWLVVGNLRGDPDRYRARAHSGKRVRWKVGQL